MGAVFSRTTVVGIIPKYEQKNYIDKIGEVT